MRNQHLLLVRPSWGRIGRLRQNTAEVAVVTGGIAEVVIDVRHLQVLLCSYWFFIASLIVFYTAISLNLRSVHSSLHPRLVKLPQHQPFGPLDKLDMHPRRPSSELVIFADMTQTLSRRLVQRAQRRQRRAPQHLRFCEESPCNNGD